MSRPNQQRRQHLTGTYRHGSQHGAGDDLPNEVWWQVRYYAARQVSFYLTVRIRQPHLRACIIEHVAVNWLRSCGIEGHADQLAGLFHAYCLDVERDADPHAKDTDWELHRVWTNHAVLLGGELDEVCWRPLPRAKT